MKTRQYRKQGFTLTEIMVVVGIIGLIVAVALPSLLNSMRASQEKIRQRNVVNIEKAKGILQMPASIHGRLGKELTDGATYGTDFTEEDLFACIRWVESTDDLDVNGDPIIVGNIGEHAYYPASSAASNP